MKININPSQEDVTLFVGKVDAGLNRIERLAVGAVADRDAIGEGAFVAENWRQLVVRVTEELRAIDKIMIEATAELIEFKERVKE